MFTSRQRRFYSVSLVFCAAALVVSPSFVAAAAVKNPTAASVLKAAKTALSKETSVHIKVTSKSGKVTSHLVVDIGKTSGIETITSGPQHITISITPEYAFLRGNSGGLSTMMGLTAAQVKKVGNRTIAMKAGSAQYKDFKTNLTSSVLVALLPSLKGTSFSMASNMSKKVYQLRWSTKATSSTQKTSSVLTISSDKLALPIKETITSSSGGGTTVFSKWGEMFNVAVPPSSTIITYAKVFG